MSPLRSSTASSKPPMSAYDSSGAFSTFITDTIVSTLSCKPITHARTKTIVKLNRPSS